MNSPGWLVPNMVLEKSREIAPEEMKRMNQSGGKKKTQNTVMDVSGVKLKSSAIENNIA